MSEFEKIYKMLWLIAIELVVVCILIINSGCTSAFFPDDLYLLGLVGESESTGQFDHNFTGVPAFPLATDGDVWFVGGMIRFDLEEFQPKGPLHDRYGHRNAAGR